MKLHRKILFRMMTSLILKQETVSWIFEKNVLMGMVGPEKEEELQLEIRCAGSGTLRKILRGHAFA
jgi:hypothetical protein